LIVPYAAGGGNDIVERLMGQWLSERLGQSFVIENRPGAGTTLGTKAGAMADPDGYTLVQVNAALSYAPVLYPNPGYDPAKSFVPIALLASWSHVLGAHPSVPATRSKN
jgi:tripartite-type tricarboxylate transporter receptor subunit TctC